MGNLCIKCFKFQKSNSKYIRSDLSQSRDLSIEFENLMTNDYYDELSVPSKKRNPGAPFTVASYMQWLSDQEKAFMDDEDDENKDSSYPLSGNETTINYTDQNKMKFNNNLFPQASNNNPLISNVPNNWCTFEDKIEIGTEGQLTNDQLTGYYLDELSRDITMTRDLADPNDPVLYEEEEIDGPELARLIRRMRPRDLFLTGGNRDILTSAHSTILIGNSSSLLDKDSSIANLYTKIHQNLMKGIRDTRSVTNSERDHSSVDLDWDHEPGMNPSLALVHKRTDTEEDLIKRLNSEEIKESEAPTLKNPTNSSKLHQLNTVDNNPIKTEKKQLKISSINKENNYNSSILSPMDCTDELVWDMEEDIYTGNPNQFSNTNQTHHHHQPVYLSSFCSSNSVVPSDKRHLLSE